MPYCMENINTWTKLSEKLVLYNFSVLLFTSWNHIYNNVIDWEYTATNNSFTQATISFFSVGSGDSIDPLPPFLNNPKI